MEIKIGECFPDCKFNFICDKETISLKLHRCVLSQSEYFEKLFQYEKVLFENGFIIYNVTVNCHKKSLEWVLDFIYSKINSQDVILNNEFFIYLVEIIDLIYFFQLEDKLIEKFIIKLSKLLVSLEELELNANDSLSSDEWNSFLLHISESALDMKFKENIFARFFYLIGKENYKIWQLNYKSLIPTTFFNCQKLEDSNKYYFTKIGYLEKRIHFETLSFHTILNTVNSTDDNEIMFEICFKPGIEQNDPKYTDPNFWKKAKLKATLFHPVFGLESNFGKCNFRLLDIKFEDKIIVFPNRYRNSTNLQTYSSFFYVKNRSLIAFQYELEFL